MHSLDLGVITLQFTQDHLFVDTLLESVFNLIKVLNNLGEFF